jgi:hypothetical protein
MSASLNLECKFFQYLEVSLFFYIYSLPPATYTLSKLSKSTTAQQGFILKMSITIGKVVQVIKLEVTYIGFRRQISVTTNIYLCLSISATI